MLRAPAHSSDVTSRWPDVELESAQEWAGWLKDIWSEPDVREAIGHASPALAESVEALCGGSHINIRASRRAALATMRYLLRMTGRSVPFGLLAGVGAVKFGNEPGVHWGTHHQVIARANGQWLAAVAGILESAPRTVRCLSVMTNTSTFMRGDWIVVPYRLNWSEPSRPELAEISVRYTPAVRVITEAARTPTVVEELISAVLVAFPGAGPDEVPQMISKLIASCVLISGLHAPATEPDALGHLLDQLGRAGRSAQDEPILVALRYINEQLDTHNRVLPVEQRPRRDRIAARMHDVVPGRSQPLSLDLVLDVDATLPFEVARDAERAASALMRLSAAPAGPPALRMYHARFNERYGLGATVPLLDMVSDSGIGWPDGYPGAKPAPPPHVTRRDEALLALAQAAALDGRREIVVDERLMARLDPETTRTRPPPHLELCFRIHASTAAALQRGDYRMEVTAVSRGAGTMTGRFLSCFAGGQGGRLAESVASLPCRDADTEAIQLSFAPFDPAAAPVVRVPQVLPRLISISEYRSTWRDVLTVGDLAVGSDGQHMYLTVPSIGKRVEATMMHALSLETQTPPMARLVSQLSRSGCARVTMFDWGAAATLPYLPRLRLGRIVLSPARWLLDAGDLPGRREAWPRWKRQIRTLLARRRVPDHVYLADGQLNLAIDLAQPAHLYLLRTHLDAVGRVALAEAPSPADLSWSAGRPFEVILPLAARTAPAASPRAPQATRLLTRDHGNLPAVSPTLLACLYGNALRQDLVLRDYLPDLLAMLDCSSGWWFMRYRDSLHHIRVRIPLLSADMYGGTVRAISDWSSGLRNAGLLAEVRYQTDYPETGRWGSGSAWSAAKDIFHADSQAIITQLHTSGKPHRQSLAAVHAVAICVAYCGGALSGMHWLIEHIPARAPVLVPRPLLNEARQLASPDGNWAGLRSMAAGERIRDAIAPRDAAVASYSRHIAGANTSGISSDEVLRSLLHLNFIRGCGIDPQVEQVVLYLARCAALAWTAIYTGV